MTHNTDVQHTGLTNVRNSRKLSRFQLALASGGVAGALLLGGLFGFHGGGATAQAHAAKQAASVVSNRANHSVTSTFQVKTVPLSYGVSTSYVDVARQAAVSAGINPDTFVRQIRQESGFNPSATSPAGAVGIAQFMPATAASMGVNPHDPVQALKGAARLMANLKAQFGGDYAKALAAYNAGPGAVQSAVARGGGNWLAFTPSETQNYVRVIMG